jgi:translation initiation factor 1
MGLFDGTSLQRPVTCELCEKPLDECRCPRDASDQILPPQKQTAMIRLEKRPGGKVVTLIEGLDPSASDLDELLKQLKSKCATGGTVKEGVIELQGDHRAVALTMLSLMGYRTKLP